MNALPQGLLHGKGYWGPVLCLGCLDSADLSVDSFPRSIAPFYVTGRAGLKNARRVL
jgi:hypothetical protein